MAKKQSFDAQMLVKHHYWILAGLGGIALPIFWYLASGSLAEVFDAGKKAREDVRKQVEGFQAAQQPNEEINKEAGTRHGRQNQEVYAAWQFQYARQQKCMHWNLPAIGDMWDPWLLNGVDSKGEPVTGLASESEQIALENARTKGTELNQQVRILYGSWLNDALALPESYDLTDARTLQFRRLYLLIDLRRPIITRVDEEEPAKAKGKEQKKVGGLLEPLGPKREKEPGDRIAGTQYIGRVSWTESERMYLEHKFGRSEVWRRNPTTAQVIYTQESMNVYAMLLYYIVAKTNGNQAEHQFLAIKQIITMRLGEDCQLLSKDGAGPGGVGGGPGAGGPGAGGLGAGAVGAGAVGAGAVGASGPGGGVGGGNAGQDPWAPFVVGPLSGSGGGGGGGGGGPGGVRPGAGMAAVGAAGGGNAQAQGGGPTEGANRYVDYEGFAAKVQPSAEYRMLPVVMRLVMDHRMLPEVQACCAESPLPIKITQLNLREPGSTEGGGGGVGGGDGMGPGGAAPGAPGAGGFGGAGPGAGGVGAAAGPRAAGGVGRKENPIRADGFGGEIELGPYDREVEIKGVIYIYNPPDLAKVGKGADAADVPAAAPVVPEAKQPAGAPEKTPAVEPSAKTPDPDGKTPPSGEGLKAAAENSAAKAVTEKTGGAAKAPEKAPEKAPDPSKEPAPKPSPKPSPPAPEVGAKTPAGKS